MSRNAHKQLELFQDDQIHTIHGLQFRRPGAAAPSALITRKWPVIKSGSSSGCGENVVEQLDELGQNERTTGNKQSWGGADSPVSVIGGHNMMMMQGSNPSSGSASMEHPSASSTHHHPLSSRHYYCHQYPPATAEPSTHHDSQTLPESATDYAGLLSERVQQAFRKSHELQPHVVKKTWPPKRIEWLNLPEDPPFTARNYPLSRVYHQYSRQAGSTEHLNQENIQAAAAASSEEERLSINYSSTTRDGQEDDEDSVIDFFPSAEYCSRPNVGNMRDPRPRSGSNGRTVQDENRRGSVNRRSSCMRSAAGGHHHHDHTAAAVEDESKLFEGGRVSTSYKWDDAERWLTSPTAASAASAPPLRQPPFSNAVDPHGLAKAGSCQVQARKLLFEPTCTQDKHIPVNGFMKEAGTELRKDIKRDIATQSTPAQWSRCDSPEAEEGAILSSTTDDPEKANAVERQAAVYVDQGPSTQKTSPPRHNTPARRSVSCTKERGNRNAQNPRQPNYNGKLNLVELESCHLEKLRLARDLPLGTSSTWLLFAEEESPTKVQFLEQRPAHQQQQGMKVNMLEARVSAWEDVERAKHLAKFKREQAKIEAWESLQRAEADAELRKLEVKLQKMRFEGREKIMGRLGAAQRRAQEMQGVAEAQKAEQLTRVAMRASQIRKSGHLPSSTFNVMCSLSTKIKPTSNLSFS
ncbi:hypothetical protein GOP47_0007678 [Adiantum capillus-veneris]|uniref:Remorin C-terminal domain-containing protein n=1 Tax=Adiantum capillus-veneris TaxID=13818 RepID=A0A9D4V1H7_ADICA|nr:hypothetical protein GOP47_0007678 [Adiantum capillus-veneris]